MTVYVKNVDYPSDFGNKYKNLVASGQRPTQRVYFQHPANSGEYYELFYDVYLVEFQEDLANPFIYEFVYWTIPVKLSSRGTSSVPKPGANPLLQNTWEAGTAYLFELKIGVFNYPLLSNARFWQTTRAWYDFNSARSMRMPASSPQPAEVSSPTTPADFGWRAVGAGGPSLNRATGIPGRGAGGLPYYDPATSKPDKPVVSAPTPAEDPAGAAEPAVTYTPARKRDLRFNPPLISTASGAYVGVNLGGDGRRFDRTPPNTRQVIVGSGTAFQKHMRKGTIQPYILNEDVAKVTKDGYVLTGKPGAKKPVRDSWAVGDSVLDPKVAYGFRFHYNPAEISFTSLPVDAIDPALWKSGLDQAMLVAADGATISMTLYLNRIEDMSFLSKDGRGKVSQYRDLYAGRKMLQEDIEGIAERGTGYDLEFLYRAAMGKPSNTLLRGETSDLGVILGLPLMLNLGTRKMRYQGRLGSLNYTHTSFTEDMIPMMTTVSISFSRVPDVAQAGEST